MRVREPFGYSEAQRYSLDEIARDIGVELIRDCFKWLDARQSVIHTEGVPRSDTTRWLLIWIRVTVRRYVDARACWLARTT
jgi:hypothetical protein